MLITSRACPVEASNKTSANNYSSQQAAGSQQQPFDEQQVQLAGLGDFSQADGQQQQQEDADSLGSSPRGQQQRPNQQQSFLIPLALVQSDSGSGSAGNFNNADNLFGGQHSDQHLAGRRSPAQIHQQQVRMAAAAASNQPSISHSLNTGFMSSFLSAEKEKMTAAALRLHQAASQVTSAVANYSSPPLTSSTSLAPPLAPPNHPKAAGYHHHHHHGPGGLMPVMMMPLSRMPDSAIGQAYGAAVGNALPIESGKFLLLSRLRRHRKGAHNQNTLSKHTNVVRVCEQERERERERNSELIHLVSFNGDVRPFLDTTATTAEPTNNTNRN